MFEDVKYLKFKSYLNTYCPHCRNTFNVEIKDRKYIQFKAVYKGEDIDLKLSPYLDVFDVESSKEIAKDDLLEDLLCPRCKKSLIVVEKPCGDCGSPVAEVIIAAFSRLLPFYMCMKHGCTWHGLTKADENKIKLKIPRQEMPEQDMKLRVANHGEVPYGYTTELAQLEAGRCLQCKEPKCVNGCPVNVDIPSFIKLIRDEKIDDAAKKIKERNILPAICGRVCPQESQCESLCILGIKDRPVAIGNLERFVADYERKMELVKIPTITARLNKKIAVVGSGPAGLTVAADLIQKGYSVTIFEALHEAGGVLVYGIPEFRLPKAIVNFEIDYLKQMGVRIEMNTVIGKTIEMDELLQNFDAVFIGVGAGLPVFMNLPGETLGNVFSANEYLTRMNLMKAYKFPEYDTPKPRGNRVVVIGGGNVAMDSARTAIRTGSSEVIIVYRRSRQELPARHEEVRHAEEEGVKFMLLTNPVRYIGNDQGLLKGMECIRMKLGEPDSSGRRRPVPIEGSNFIIDCDVAVVAIGTSSNPVLFQTAQDIKRNKWGYVEVNPETNETSKEFVYAGGDIVTGSATVIEAMGAGRIAANAIQKKLAG
ncbi:MAG TPA: NADPH-dependent glutamate synthase [Ignavibacteria bacterium]|nr:NADPH-dependent glutamate synthase [Ignavibacteria bacterium]